MNDQRIRTGAILTAALMLFGLAGCGNFRERANQQDEVSAETRSESSYLLHYKLSRYEMSQGKQAIFFQEEDENGFLALIDRKTGEEIPEEKQKDPDFVNDGRYEIYTKEPYHIGKKGKQALLRDYRPVSEPKEPENVDSYRSEVHLKALRYGENGQIICVEQSYERWLDPKTTPQFHTRDRWYIRILDEKGAELDCNEIELPKADEGLDCGNLVYLGNDLVAVPHGRRVLFFGIDGKERFSVSTPLPIQELCRIGQGKLAVLLKQEQTLWLSVVDSAERSASVPKEIPAGSHAFCRGEDESVLYFIRNTELFRIYLSNWEIERVDSLLSIGVEPTSIAAMFVRPDGSLHFILHEWDPVKEATRENYAVAVQVNEIHDGIALRIGFQSISGSLKRAILQFNQDHTDIHIEPVDYSNLGTEATDTVELLVLRETDYETLLAEEKLADLEPMLSADRDYSQDQFFLSVWSTLSSPDGSLRRLASNFRIESMACDSEAIAGRTVMNLSDLRTHREEMGAGASLYEPWYTSERLLKDLLYVNRRALGTEGSPEYDQSLYEELKQFSACQPEVYNYNSYTADPSSMEKRIGEGRLLFIQAHVGSIQEFKWYDAFFESGVSFPGWPTMTGSFSQICFDECLAVNASCSDEEREAAWQFLRILLSDEFASECYGFPVRFAVLEKWLEEDASAVSYRVDEDGEFELDDDGEKIEIARRSWYSPEWKRHYEYAITDDQCEKLLELIRRSI